MAINNFVRYAEGGQQNGIINTLRRMNGIFPTVYLWTIFSLASLNTLCRICDELPRLHASVNKYFAYHFRGKSIFVDESCCRRIDRYFIHFWRSIQQVRVYGMSVNVFNFVSSHFSTLTKITFEDELIGDSNVPWQWADILANTMRTVETVVFKLRQTVFEGAIFDRLLFHARQNIRILIIDTLPAKSKIYDVFELDGNRWYSQLYPRLTTLQWDDGITYNPLALLRLLRNNSDIRHLIFTRNICSVLDFLEDYNVRLQRLDVTIRADDLPHIALIVDRLNRLSENGHFRYLHISCTNSEIFNYRLNELRGLKGLTFNDAYIPAIGDITQLVELKIDSFDTADDGLDAALQLTALSTLYVTRASLDAISPLISYAPQIMKIVIKNIEIESLNVHTLKNLVEQRSRLPNAQRLKIYLDEPTYCMLKPYETEDSTQWITILRNDELLNPI